MLTVFNGSLDIGHHNRFMNRFWIRYNANVRIGNYNNINERSWLRADEQITILYLSRSRKIKIFLHAVFCQITHS